MSHRPCVAEFTDLRILPWFGSARNYITESLQNCSIFVLCSSPFNFVMPIFTPICVIFLYFLYFSSDIFCRVSHALWKSCVLAFKSCWQISVCFWYSEFLLRAGSELLLSLSFHFTEIKYSFQSVEGGSWLNILSSIAQLCSHPFPGSASGPAWLISVPLLTVLQSCKNENNHI